jgi:hypothetical protein
MTPVADQKRDVEHQIAAVQPVQDTRARLREIEAAGLQLVDEIGFLAEKTVRIGHDGDLAPRPFLHERGEIEHRVMDRVGRRQAVSKPQGARGPHRRPGRGEAAEGRPREQGRAAGRTSQGCAMPAGRRPNG